MTRSSVNIGLVIAAMVSNTNTIYTAPLCLLGVEACFSHICVLVAMIWMTFEYLSIHSNNRHNRTLKFINILMFHSIVLILFVDLPINMFSSNFD